MASMMPGEKMFFMDDGFGIKAKVGNDGYKKKFSFGLVSRRLR
jgi:hypothetical protein